MFATGLYVCIYVFSICAVQCKFLIYGSCYRHYRELTSHKQFDLNKNRLMWSNIIQKDTKEYRDKKHKTGERGE